jgi:hypothetical protein
MRDETPKERPVLREPLFEQELMQLGLDAVSADEFTRGAEWILSRNARYGTKVAKDVWFLPIAQLSPPISASLYYTFDDTRIYFLSIRRAPNEIEE